MYLLLFEQQLPAKATLNRKKKKLFLICIHEHKIIVTKKPWFLCPTFWVMELHVQAAKEVLF